VSTVRGQPAQARIRAADGWPVADAVLTVTDLTGNQVAHVFADGAGTVRTGPLPAAAYTAIVTAPGFEPVARTATVGASAPAALGVITLDRAGGNALIKSGPWTIDPVHSSITVSVRHLGFASIRGRFAEFGGRIEVGSPFEASTVSVTIDAAGIDTGNHMRDEHLRSADFLAVEEFPEISFRGVGLEPSGCGRWRMRGELALRDVVRPVELAVSYLGAGADPWGGVRTAFHAEAELHREDFGITYNQALTAGVSAIGATLRVEIDVEAVRGDTLPS
jgi:polyisoprenoid-binding protein YceI